MQQPPILTRLYESTCAIYGQINVISKQRDLLNKNVRRVIIIVRCSKIRNIYVFNKWTYPIQSIEYFIKCVFLAVTKRFVK